MQMTTGFLSRMMPAQYMLHVIKVVKAANVCSLILLLDKHLGLQTCVDKLLHCWC